MICEPCDVTWNANVDGEHCWVCEKPGKGPKPWRGPGSSPSGLQAMATARAATASPVNGDPILRRMTKFRNEILGAAIALALMNGATRSGIVWHTGYGLSQVSRAVNWLVNQGLLVQHDAGGWTSYTVTPVGVRTYRSASAALRSVNR